MLMASILYRQGAYRDLALERLNALFGPVAVQGPEFAFDQTTYYEAEMGAYRQGGFSALPWTYPDYASRELQEVLLVMRQHLLAALRRSTAPDPAHGKCRPAADRTR